MSPSENNQDHFSVREAAKFAKVSYETVARWIRNSQLKAKKTKVKGLKEEWRIKKADLVSFLA